MPYSFKYTLHQKNAWADAGFITIYFFIVMEKASTAAANNFSRL